MSPEGRAKLQGLGWPWPAGEPEGAATAWRSRLSAWYAEHNPARVASVGQLLQKYRGRENEMFGAMAAKYYPLAPPKAASGPAAGAAAAVLAPAAGAGATSAATSTAEAAAAEPAADVGGGTGEASMQLPAAAHTAVVASAHV